MTLANDIAAARASGKTDDYLLNAYKAYDPDKASDIDAAIEKGHDPAHVLDALSAYDAQYGNHIENQGIGAKTTGALRQGVADELRGLGATAKESLGPGLTSATLSALGDAAAPSDYQPASEGLGDATKTIGDRAGYIPRSLLEGAPGLATDIAAGSIGARVGGAVGLVGGPFAEVTVPVGAALGGAVGFGGSYLLRNYGKDTERSAAARTGDPNATPNDDDRTRALTAGLVSAGLSRVGVGKALGEAGADALLPAIQGFGRAAVTDAGTSAAADALNTAIVDHKNPLDDPSGLAISGLQGAVTGVGLRTVTAAGDANNALKFRDIDPVQGSALADLYKWKDQSTPAKAFEAMKDVDRHLGLTADHWTERTQPQIDALDQASGYRDDTGLLLKQTRQSLADGNVVDKGTLETLRDRLGDYSEGDNLLTTLTLQNTQNQLRALGNYREKPDGSGTFGGGIADTSFMRNFLNPIGRFGKFGPHAVVADLGLSHLLPTVSLHPGIAGALGVAQAGTYAGAKAIDGVLRNTNPVAEFSRRFGYDDPAPQSLERPSFAQQDAVANKTAQDVADLAQKAVTSRRAQTNTKASGGPLSFQDIVHLQDLIRRYTATGTDRLRHVRVGDQTVSFDPTTVANPERYAASITRRMHDRMEVINAAKGLLPPDQQGVMDTLHTELTHNSSNTAQGAYDRIEAVNKLPHAFQAAVLGALDHPKLWASFAR